MDDRVLFCFLWGFLIGFYRLMYSFIRFLRVSTEPMRNCLPVARQMAVCLDLHKHLHQCCISIGDFMCCSMHTTPGTVGALTRSRA